MIFKFLKKDKEKPDANEESINIACLLIHAAKIDEQYSDILSKKTNFGISEALFNQFKSQVVNERKK